MQKVKNSKVNGRVKRRTSSKLLITSTSMFLLFFTFCMINPLGVDDGKVHALDTDDKLVGSIDSQVGIVFSEVAGSKELVPSPGVARATQLTVNATVSVENSGEYSVYVGSKSSNLVGKSTGSIIPGMVGERTYDEIEPNTWGYYAGSGDSIPEDASYKALTKGMGDVVFANHDTQIKSETRNIALGFVAKVNTDIPADVYENEITLSVVSSPRQLSFNVNTNARTYSYRMC